jgi:hypothetical protein
MKTETPEKPAAKAFDRLLAELDDGGVVQKVDEELVGLVRKTLECARAKGPAGAAVGTLSLKLTFKVDAAGEVEIRAGHTVTTPTLPRALNCRWINPKTMEIVDANPKQLGLTFKEAPLPPTELRSVE